MKFLKHCFEFYSKSLHFRPCKSYIYDIVFVKTMMHEKILISLCNSIEIKKNKKRCNATKPDFQQFNQELI